MLLSDTRGGAGWHEAAERVADRLPVRLVSCRVGDAPDAELRPEEGADWARAHGTTPDGAVLVRPDGFVAWRSRGAAEDPQETLAKVLGSLLDLA